MILILFPRPSLPRPITDDESRPLAPTFVPDVELWAVSAPQRLAAPPILILDDEVLPNAKNLGIEDEYLWTKQVQAIPAVPLQAITDDDVLAILLIDEDYWWTAQTETLPKPPLQAVTDDELLARLGLDEDFWWVPTYRGYTVPMQAITDDEVMPGAKNFALDEDAYQASALFSRSIIRQAISDQDELATAAAPSIIDEDAWLSLGAIVQTWTARLPADDEALALLGLEDDVQTSSAPILRTWLSAPITDTDELALLGIEEDGWTAIPPRWFSTALQTIVDDLASVPTMVDDDPWRAPTLHRLGNSPTPIWDVELINVSGIRIRLVQLFTVRCAKTMPMTVACAKTKPVTVRTTKTITLNVPV